MTIKKKLLIGLAALSLLFVSGRTILAQDDNVEQERQQERRDEREEREEERDDREEERQERQERQDERREGVCANIEAAWEERNDGYERAREVRKKAFERTYERWEVLFDRLDEREVDTEMVRADAAVVKTKFEALIRADDAVIEAMKDLAEANCEGEGQSEARTALSNAQRARREARAAYNNALRKFHTDLSGLRSQLRSGTNNQENN